MVFDNYVVAYYSDLIHRAVATQQKVSAKEEQKVRERRRDPILFGVIKNSRKLYYICDWTTDTDDLTLEKLEKELGVTRSSLVAGAMTQNGSRGEEVTTGTYDDRRIMDIIRREIDRERTETVYRIGGNPLSGGSWSFNGMYS